MWEILIFDPILVPDHSKDSNRLMSLHSDPSHPREGDSEHEGIVMDLDDTKRFYLLSEAQELHKNEWFPVIRTAEVMSSGAEYQITKECWIDLPLHSKDRSYENGLEGLDLIKIDGETYFVGICEGGGCHKLENSKLEKLDKSGDSEGRGMLVVIPFDPITDSTYPPFDCKYNTVDEGKILLPQSAEFKDYSDLRHRVTSDENVYLLVVLSQLGRGFWTGQVTWSKGDGDSVSADFSGDCKRQDFPQNGAGEDMFCNVEGVAWRCSEVEGETTQFVMVSDGVKNGDDEECEATDQSVHIFKQRFK